MCNCHCLTISSGVEFVQLFQIHGNIYSRESDFLMPGFLVQLKLFRNFKDIIIVRVTFDGTLSFRRKCFTTYCAVISWDRTDHRLVELQEMSSCTVPRINTYLQIVVSPSCRNIHVPTVVWSSKQSNAHLVVS